MQDQPTKVLVILGHPRVDSYCGALASAYAEGAVEAGHEVRRYNLADMEFDLRSDGRYLRDRAPLEPALVELQEAVQWAEHLVFVYPTWWGVMPALLKAFFDRAFVPGFAFRYRKGSPFVDKLLRGRSARVIVTMDSPPWYFRHVTGMPGHRQIRKSILEFCGVTPVRIHPVGPVRASTLEQRQHWLAQVRALGARR